MVSIQDLIGKEHPYGDDVFRTILGNVSDNGLPSEDKAYYLKKGYAFR